MNNKVRVLLGLVFVVFNTIHAQSLCFKPGQYQVDIEHDFKVKSAAPITFIKDLSPCQGTNFIEVPVYVNEFANIGSVSLTMSYDPSVFTYQSFVNNSGFPGLSVVEGMPGTLTTAAFTTLANGVSYSDSTILYTLQFLYAGGSSVLSWYDDGASCEYSGPAPLYATLEDQPTNVYYANGTLQQMLVPGSAGSITGPVDGMVCKGQTNVAFSVAPVAYATQYFWTLPMGATVVAGYGTSSILVNIEPDAVSGMVSVSPGNECGVGGSSPVFELVVNSSPLILVQPESPAPVMAGQGTALFSVEASGDQRTYQWQEYIESWNDLEEQGYYTGVTTENLLITNPSISMDGYKYRCLVSGFCPPAALSNGEASLTVFDLMRVDDQQIPSKDLHVRVFPCPASSETAIYVDSRFSGNLLVNIISASGITMESYEITDTGFADYKIPVRCQNWADGVYCIQVLLNAQGTLFCANSKMLLNKYK
jgi:hypothetical protein